MNWKQKKIQIETAPKMPGDGQWRDTGGFTLVELLISVAVIGILAGMAAQTFTAVINSRDVAIRRIEANETARAALDFIASELKTAYITPDSVNPVESSRPSPRVSETPRFRFAGIRRDIDVTDRSNARQYPIPGVGEDDDGDGLVDEEILDGLQGDYKTGFNGQPSADPLGCEDGDSACIDEDIGMFPSDILHFVSAIEDEGSMVLQEISYGLDTTGTRLMRRMEVLNLNDRSQSRRTDILVNFGRFIDLTTGERLLPDPVPIGRGVSRSEVNRSIEHWDKGTEQGSLGANIEANNASNKRFQVLAYDVRGIRISYWYYDYNRGGWRMTQEWDSARETALMGFGEPIFTQPARNIGGAEGGNRSFFERLIVNEPEDMYPKAGSGLQFAITNPGALITSPEWQGAAKRIGQRTDGLPNMVEVTIYVQDREREFNPKPFTRRIFVPNNYRSLGKIM